MSTLLHIDSSPMNDASVSRALSRHFVHTWKAANPNGTVIVRDLTTTEIPPVSADFIAASFTPADVRTPAQVAALQLSETLLGELERADEYAFGVPMHNFSVAAVFKLWIDQIVRAGRTFAYVDGAPKGLLEGKRATVLTASGGVYDAGTALASLNFVEPYLRTVLGFIGVTDVTVVNAGGTAALRHGGDRQALLQPHIASIERRLDAARAA